MAIRLALRSLRRTPAFTLAAVLTLVVGIASAGAMFAVVYGLLLAPLPYAEPERLVSVRLQAPDSGEIPMPPALQVLYSRDARTLDAVAFYRTGSTNVWTEGGDADSVVATWASASTIAMLGAQPLLGRSFTPEEEVRGGPDAVILGEAEWRNRFGAAPDVIGRTLMVNSVAREIVGVMPESFAFPMLPERTRLWLPAKRAGDATVGEFAYAGVARLAPGATVDDAGRELATILPRLADAFPRLQSGGATAAWLADSRAVPQVVPLRDEITGGIAQTLWMLAAAAGLVLLVALANVANLLLVRADARQAELAVRAALGASGLRIAMPFAAEALVLGATAGMLALLLVHGAVAVLVAYGPADVPRLAQLGVGAPATLFVVVASALGACVCAVVPALRSWRAGASPNLREGGRNASAGRSRLRVRAAVATLQVAVALVVTVGSALLLRTAHELHQVRPGFDAAQVTTLRTQLPMARYGEAEAVAFYARLVEQVRQLPSVQDAGVARKVPLGSGAPLEEVFGSDADASTRALPVAVVDDGYFAALSIPLLAGRGFRSPRLERGTDVVISRQAAATVFGDATGTASVGRRLRLAPSGPEYDVVGVVGDVRDEALAKAPSALVYRALSVRVDPAVEPATPRNMALVVRSSGGTAALVPAIRRIVRELDPTVPMYGVAAMRDTVRASTSRLALALACISFAAAITLLLGTIGLYGVMAYMVALRTREFGVRVALGADPHGIARLVAKHGFGLTAIGIAAGFAAYALAAPLLRAFLFGVTVADPATLAGATLVLLATAGLASWLPARRAARVDPALALRAD